MADRTTTPAIARLLKLPVPPGETQPEAEHIDLNKTVQSTSFVFGSDGKQFIILACSADGVLHVMPPASANKIKKTYAMIDQQVAAPGTAEAISATELLVSHAIFQAKQLDAVNVGDVTWGDSSVQLTVLDGPIVSPGESFELRCDPGEVIDLNEIYIDAANAGDGFIVNYLPA